MKYYKLILSISFSLLFAISVYTISGSFGATFSIFGGSIILSEYLNEIAKQKKR